MLTPSEDERFVLSQEVPTPIGAPHSAAGLEQDTEIAARQLGQLELIWIRFRRHKFALIGATVIGLLILMAVFAPIISPESPLGYNYMASNVPPRWTWPWNHDWRYVMGSDTNGHALLMWIAYGARVSLAVGMFSALLTSVIGIILGGIAGYYGGWTDTIIMRATDVVLTLPFLPLIILLSYYVTGGNWVLIVLIFGLLGWPGVARLIRSYYLSFTRQEFTEAARAVGVSDARIIFRHILPNALSPVIVSTTLAVAGFIVAEAAIDFLGVGIRWPSVSWGLALSNSQNYFGVGNWWWTVFPGLFILITVLAINFMGDGLRDALDVRSRAGE